MRIKNPKAYYTVTALDVRHNQSIESKEVIIIKPDKIPPTSPVFEDYVISEGEIVIKWINSSDEDVKAVLLQRKSEDDAVWNTVFSSNKRETSYKDKQLVPLKKYWYRLYAVDSSGLWSGDAQVLQVTAARIVNRKAIINMDALVDREKKLLYVNWEYDKGAKVKSVEIFRGDENTPISLYKVLSPANKELLEKDLIINTRYTYGLRVQFISGEYSDMTIKEVNY
jgi:hypothetical protein